MVNRLLFIHQKPVQLVVAIAGALTGFLLLLGSLQLYFDFDRLIHGSSDINAPQFLVINKQVSLVNTLFGGQKGFSTEEITELKSKEGVLDVAGLTPSRFRVSVSMGEGGLQGIPGMYTEMFFESVPDAFLDVPADRWKWLPGDSTVPIIIPRDYIKLYNFGFAPTQGLPQLTEDIVGMATFKVTLMTKKGRIIYKGRIAGFTERINTILAPQAFIDHANAEYAGVTPGSVEPSRVIIRCQGPATQSLADFFSENGYETSEESLRNSRISTAMNLIMNILVVIGSVIILLSLLGFLQYSQLLVSKSQYEIRTLCGIGHSPRALIFRYMKYYSLVFGGVTVSGLISVYFIKAWIKSFALTKGFALQGGLDGAVWLSALVLLLLFLTLNFLSLRKNILRLV